MTAPIVTATVNVNIPGLERYQKRINEQLNSGVDGPVQRALFQWAVRYRSFIQRRFNTYARGGGDWAPLSPLTIARRRKGKSARSKRMAKGDFRSAADRRISSVKIKHRKSGKSYLAIKRRKPIKKKPQTVSATSVAILRDTSSLFNALAPVITAPAGSVNKIIPGGIEVGYGGASQHNSNGITIAELAYWHQTGAGNLPVRQIIVDPDSATILGMVTDMQRACNSDQ